MTKKFTVFYDTRLRELLQKEPDLRRSRGFVRTIQVVNEIQMYAAQLRAYRPPDWFPRDLNNGFCLYWELNPQPSEEESDSSRHMLDVSATALEAFEVAHRIECLLSVFDTRGLREGRCNFEMTTCFMRKNEPPHGNYPGWLHKIHAWINAETGRIG